MAKIIDKVIFNNIKEELINNVNEVVTNQSKKYFTRWLKESGIPQLKEIADVYTNKLKEDATKEAGWSKIRDGVVLPICIAVALNIIDSVIGKIIEKTDEEEVQQ